jgi:hypothetical protein
MARAAGSGGLGARQLRSLGFNPTDDGYVLAQASRVLSGQVPHRDIASPRPLGSALLHVSTCFLPLPLFEATRLSPSCISRPPPTVSPIWPSFHRRRLRAGRSDSIRSQALSSAASTASMSRAAASSPSTAPGEDSGPGFETSPANRRYRLQPTGQKQDDENQKDQSTGSIVHDAPPRIS